MKQDTAIKTAFFGMMGFYLGIGIVMIYVLGFVGAGYVLYHFLKKYW